MRRQRAFELVQRKVQIGFKDLKGFIKNQLYARQPARITILIGQNAIIDNDIKHQLKDAAVAYEIDFSGKYD